MRKLICLITSVILVSTGCSTAPHNSNKLETKDVENFEIAKEIPLNYSIEKTILTKGYQSIEPYIETLNTTESFSLLISLGLIECSAVFIERITKFNNEINIYTTKIMESEKSDIYVPQIILTLNDLDNKDLENKKINIIATNYKPIELSYNLSQVLNNIYAQAKIQVNNTPEVKLKKIDNSYFWDISIYNAFDKVNIGNPLVNVTAEVNSSTGEIISLDKEIIAEYVDEGNILEVSYDNILFYKVKIEDNEQSREILLMYDGENKKQIYSTFNSIFSVKYNPKIKSVAIIENKDENTEIFIVNMKKNTVLKITPIGYNHTWNIKWNNETLYFVNNDSHSKSTVFKYNLPKNEIIKVLELDKAISSFDVSKNLFIFNQFNDESPNTDIFVTVDGKDIKYIGSGFNCSFLSDDKIIYMDNLINHNKSRLWLYNLKTNSHECITESNVGKFYIRDENTLNIVESNDYNTEFTLYKYNINSKQKTEIMQIVSKDVFFSSRELYINIIPNLKENSDYNVYRIISDKF